MKPEGNNSSQRIFGMPSRRNPNSIFACQLDEDTVDSQRSSNLALRNSERTRRLLNDKSRTIGVDNNALIEQMNIKSQRMHKVDQEKLEDFHKIQMLNEERRKEQSARECEKQRSSRDYADFLRAQCLERQSKGDVQVDFDTKHLIGYQVHPRDDIVARRRMMASYQEDLRKQIEAKVHETPESVDISHPPIDESEKVNEYHEKIKREFLEGNRRLRDAKPQPARPVMTDAVTLPPSTAHSQSTDFKGLSRDETKQLLEENGRLIASKKASMLADELSDIALRSLLEKAVEDEKVLAQRVRDQKREAQKQCLSISALNAEMRHQRSPETRTDSEYFINRFGNSLIYSLLE